MTVWRTVSEHLLLTPIAPISMNVPKNKTHSLGRSNYVTMKWAVSGVTVWPTVSEHLLLTPIAPISMNVPKNKTHSLGRSNYVTMKWAVSGVTVWPTVSEDLLLTPNEPILMNVPKKNACTVPFELCQTEIGSFLCNCTYNEFERPYAGSNCTDNDEGSEEHNPCTGLYDIC